LDVFDRTCSDASAAAGACNPSTFPYLLAPITGWSSAKGQTMSAFVDYALTLGQ